MPSEGGPDVVYMSGLWLRDELVMTVRKRDVSKSISLIFEEFLVANISCCASRCELLENDLLFRSRNLRLKIHTLEILCDFFLNNFS